MSRSSVNTPRATNPVRHFKPPRTECQYLTFETVWVVAAEEEKKKREEVTAERKRVRDELEKQKQEILKEQKRQSV